MKYLKKFKTNEELNNESYKFPYPCVAMSTDGQGNQDVHFEPEQSWVKCKYSIPDDVFDENGYTDLMLGARGYIKSYKVNGKYAEIEPEQRIEGVATEIFGEITIEGTTGYLPLFEHCPEATTITSEMTFTLSRPVQPTDYVFMCAYDGEGVLQAFQPAGTVQEIISEGYYDVYFTFLDDTHYHYGDAIIAEMSGMAGFHMFLGIVDPEYFSANALQKPTLQTYAQSVQILGGIKNIGVNKSDLDENGECEIEYRMEHVETDGVLYQFIDPRFNSDVLKEIDFSALCVPMLCRDKVFWNITNLTKIVIGKNFEFETEYQNVFQYCPSLSTIEVNDSAIYDNRGNSIVHTDTNSLFATGGASWVPKDCIPTSSSFYHNSAITEVCIENMPSGSYSYLNLNDCPSLENIEINVTNHKFITIPKPLKKLSFTKGIEVLDNFFDNQNIEILELYSDSITSSMSVPQSCTISRINVQIEDLSAYSIENYIYKLESETHLFYNGEEIIDLTIPADVTEIHEAAYRRSAIINLTIPNTVALVGHTAFSDCVYLESIILDAEKTDSWSFADTPSLKTVVFGPNVKTLGDHTFEDSGLVSVEIPDTVTELQSRVFNSCNNLTHVKLPTSISEIPSGTFANCTALTSFTIPDHITKIGGLAFANTMIEEVFIPAQIESMNYNPWQQCPNLVKLSVSNENLIFDSRDNCNAIIETATNILQVGCSETIIPDSITILGTESFYGSGIQKVVLNNKCVYGHVFENCTKLTSVEILGDIDSNWGSCIFKGCTNLTEVILPTQISGSSFSEWFVNCKSLKNINIPSGITGLVKTFMNCVALESCIIPEGTEILRKVFVGCSNLVSIHIPTTLWQCLDSSFKGCKNLKEVYISDLDKYAQIYCFEIWDSPTFYGADLYLNGNKITDLVLSEGTTEIGARIFYKTKLTTMTLPSTITVIGDFAAYYSSMTTVYCKAKTVPSADKAIFADQATVYVPQEAVDNYKAHKVWKLYTIVGHNFN